MSDSQWEARAIWQLEQSGYQVYPCGGGRYYLTTVERSKELEDLAQLVVFAEVVYARVWTVQGITPSA